MTDEVLDETFRMSRSGLIEAAQEWADQADSGTQPPGASWLVSVVAPTVHLLSTAASPGEVRRAELWLSPAGVVAIAHQESDDIPTDVVALPPQEAYGLVASTALLALSAVRGVASTTVAGGLHGLVEQVVGAEGDQHLSVLDWTIDGEPSRWIILDVAGHRTGSLDAPSDPAAELLLAPLSPMDLLLSLTHRVSQGIAPAAGAGTGASER